MENKTDLRSAPDITSFIGSIDNSLVGCLINPLLPP